MKLTRIPIVIYYGDFIPKEPMTNPGQDGWRVRLAMARLWAETINRHGGDAQVVHLPEIGIRGNTHFRSRTSTTSRLPISCRSFLPTSIWTDFHRAPIAALRFPFPWKRSASADIVGLPFFCVGFHDSSRISRSVVNGKCDCATPFLKPMRFAGLNRIHASW